MNKTALAAITIGVSLAAPSAFAQACPPGSWLCADITIGGTAPAPPPVVVQTAPVVVAPRVYYLPPRPRLVYMQPPPVVVYQPAPVLTYYQTNTTTTAYYLPPRQRSVVGLQADVGGSYLGSTPTGAAGLMGGGGGGLRFHGFGHWGGEIAVNFYAGNDANGDSRLEIPVTASGLFYFNPRDRFQVYGLAGLGLSWAQVNYDPTNRWAHGGLEGDQYGYFGGQAGLGAELELTPHLAMFADVRGFLRTRIDGDTNTNPEFVQHDQAGNLQTTNTSGGAMAQAGLILYF